MQGRRIAVLVPDGRQALDAANLEEGAIWVYEDITERKRERESLLRTQFAMDRARDSILWVDEAGCIVYANDSACTSTGYARDELLTMTVFDIDPDFPAVNGSSTRKTCSGRVPCCLRAVTLPRTGAFFRWK